jgi:hypothetical protein
MPNVFLKLGVYYSLYISIDETVVLYVTLGPHAHSREPVFAAKSQVSTCLFCIATDV